MAFMKRLADQYEEEQYKDDQDDFDEDYLRPPFYNADEYLDLEQEPLELGLMDEELIDTYMMME